MYRWVITEGKCGFRLFALLLGAGVGHSGGEQQGVDGGLSDEQQERSVRLKHLPVMHEGASDGNHGGGCCRLAALLVHLKNHRQGQGPPFLGTVGGLVSY